MTRVWEHLYIGEVHQAVRPLEWFVRHLLVFFVTWKGFYIC